MKTTANDPFARRIVEQLLALRAASALPLVESAPGRNIWRWGFRAGGQPVSIDVDATVLSLRCYHDRDEIAMSPLSPAVVAAILGRGPLPDGVSKSSEAACIAELRKIVADWREGNPRLYMQPPAMQGHPDNWNRA